MAPALVSRVKIMAEMNIVERRRPQDGPSRPRGRGREPVGTVVRSADFRESRCAGVGG
jgi:type II secretory ATPase GspE/PulE/Tfp pilus assembly ATPase PilB-like protein